MERNEMDGVILGQLKDLSEQMRELRTKELPALSTQVALIEDRASRTATLISVLSSALTLTVAGFIAYFRPE